MMPADLVAALDAELAELAAAVLSPPPVAVPDAVRDELAELWDEVQHLPHDATCPLADAECLVVECTCPLGDVLDLIRDRVDSLAGAR